MQTTFSRLSMILFIDAAAATALARIAKSKLTKGGKHGHNLGLPMTDKMDGQQVCVPLRDSSCSVFTNQRGHTQTVALVYLAKTHTSQNGNGCLQS